MGADHNDQSHDDHGHDEHDDHAHAHGPDDYLVLPTAQDVRNDNSRSMAYLAFFGILVGVLVLVKYAPVIFAF